MNTLSFSRILPLLLLGIFALLPDLAQASTSSGMPWEDPLTKVVDSVTGPVAFGVSVLGVVVAGMALAFGGQLDGFIQKIAILSLVIALIVFATNVLSSVFGISSSVVAFSGVLGLPIV